MSRARIQSLERSLRQVRAQLVDPISGLPFDGIGFRPIQVCVSICDDALRDAAPAANDKAIARWRDRATAAVRRICQSMDEFTTDDVRDAIAEPVSDPRIIGNVMLAAANRGWCRKSTRTIRSRQPTNHGRPVAIWRSRLRS